MRWPVPTWQLCRPYGMLSVTLALVCSIDCSHSATHPCHLCCFLTVTIDHVQDHTLNCHCLPKPALTTHVLCSPSLARVTTLLRELFYFNFICFVFNCWSCLVVGRETVWLRRQPGRVSPFTWSHSLSLGTQYTVCYSSRYIWTEFLLSHGDVLSGTSFSLNLKWTPMWHTQF